jgi:hypothetical protein
MTKRAQGSHSVKPQNGTQYTLREGDKTILTCQTMKKKQESQ